ncbi:hypothetical protein TL16_g04743 [Triparma laevis f. inornata]|uniref:Uncharacterized protein n=1 Tax=Triparma laevis f. inornata TaxID=1714386 RepID=A0A9W7E9E3_9STRA|nr:hypothetical protein TL16_g04743 [Triparma laevis f. inornata]
MILREISASPEEKITDLDPNKIKFREQLKKQRAELQQLGQVALKSIDMTDVTGSPDPLYLNWGSDAFYRIGAANKAFSICDKMLELTEDDNNDEEIITLSNDTNDLLTIWFDFRSHPVLDVDLDQEHGAEEIAEFVSRIFFDSRGSDSGYEGLFGWYGADGADFQGAIFAFLAMTTEKVIACYGVLGGMVEDILNKIASSAHPFLQLSKKAKTTMENEPPQPSSKKAKTSMETDPPTTTTTGDSTAGEGEVIICSTRERATVVANRAKEIKADFIIFTLIFVEGTVSGGGDGWVGQEGANPIPLTCMYSSLGDYRNILLKRNFIGAQGHMDTNQGEIGKLPSANFMKLFVKSKSHYSSVPEEDDGVKEGEFVTKDGAKILSTPNAAVVLED